MVKVLCSKLKTSHICVVLPEGTHPHCHGHVNTNIWHDVNELVRT